MMLRDHDEMLLRLPGTVEEREWLEDHLEVLSVKERIALAAAVERRPPAAMADAVNHLLSLNSCAVRDCSRGYEALGDLILSEQFVPWEQRPFFDKAALGRLYEEQHPGRFIGSIYLEYPRDQYTLHYDGTDLPEAEAERWSVRLKLASEAVPEGVWIRLPDYDAAFGDDPGDIALALDELGVELLQDCTLLDARCVLPCVQDLAGQYERIHDLVHDGQELGFLLDEQYSPEFFERLSAALKFEHCRRLDDAYRIRPCLKNSEE